uniref:Uncharacterized protein n=1 Tax=Latimeria chalumnae TaxID=7897 RepID=H3AIL9_LATCH
KVSLLSRLGGHALHWSNLKDQRRSGTTLPVKHDGSFFNMELQFNQSVFTVLPAKTDVRPEMVFLFELFLLRGTNNHIDRVVGWGAFPVCDGALDLLEGKFKCPLLRGHQDSRIDQFRKIEELMSSDLDHWLSNLYFQIIKLPRYLDGQKEYEVHLQFPSNILGSPDCFCTS